MSTKKSVSIDHVTFYPDAAKGKSFEQFSKEMEHEGLKPEQLQEAYDLLTLQDQIEEKELGEKEAKASEKRQKDIAKARRKLAGEPDEEETPSNQVEANANASTERNTQTEGPQQVSPGKITGNKNTGTKKNT